MTDKVDCRLGTRHNSGFFYLLDGTRRTILLLCEGFQERSALTVAVEIQFRSLATSEVMDDISNFKSITSRERVHLKMKVIAFWQLHMLHYLALPSRRRFRFGHPFEVRLELCYIWTQF